MDLLGTQMETLTKDHSIEMSALDLENSNGTMDLSILEICKMARCMERVS